MKARDPQLPELRAKYVALLEHMDDGVGQVLTALDRLKLSENTLVLFTSDKRRLAPRGRFQRPVAERQEHMS